jgi:hypothetical protein
MCFVFGLYHFFLHRVVFVECRISNVFCTSASAAKFALYKVMLTFPYLSKPILIECTVCFTILFVRFSELTHAAEAERSEEVEGVNDDDDASEESESADSEVDEADFEDDEAESEAGENVPAEFEAGENTKTQEEVFRGDFIFLSLFS